MLENWIELQTGSAVESVNGRTGNVEVTKADVGLGNVDNTADADKPLATQEVPGLLSPGDKVKLDEADSKPKPSSFVAAPATPGSPSPGTGTIIPRGDNIVKYGTWTATFEVDEPTGDSHPATKGYVDRLVNGRGSSTGQVTATTDLNDLTSPGVYNVTSNSPNLPIVAATRSDARVEVDVLTTRHTTAEPTVRQTLRYSGGGVMTTDSVSTSSFSNSDRAQLVVSQTFRRESINGAWGEWRAEGSTPWFRMAPSVPSKGLYGIAGGPSFPGVSALHSDANKWRISNGMIELNYQFTSGVKAGQSTDNTVARVDISLRPSRSKWQSAGIIRANVGASIHPSITNAGIAFQPDNGDMYLELSGTSGGSTGVPFSLISLTWPVPVEAYGGN